MRSPWLMIDRTRVMPIVGVYVSEGVCFLKGSTQLLESHEITSIALWLARLGDRALLDAFEIALINDGQIFLWPVDEHGDALSEPPEPYEAVKFIHGDIASPIRTSSGTSPKITTRYASFCSTL